MTDQPSNNPQLDPQIAELASVLKKLNQESDSLNEVIADINSKLCSMNPGFHAWLATPIRIAKTSVPTVVWASQIGFGKSEEVWSLRLRRGKFRKDLSDKTIEETGEWTTDGPLLEAPREDRIAALPEIRNLITVMTAEARSRLERIEEAKKSVR